MMVNRQRGEISARLDGRDWTLCLTLSALAELEDHFKVKDLAQLAERLSGGRFSADDLTAILYAGLRGGGHDLERGDVALMRSELGGAGYASIVAQLLIASFGVADGGESDPMTRSGELNAN